MTTEDELAAIRNKPEAERTTEEKEALTAAERDNRDKNTEPMIPKSRLDEVLDQNRKLKEAADKAAKEKQDQETAALAEQGKWKELAENRQRDIEALTTKASLVDAYEKTLTDVLNAQLEEIPEQLRGLVPEGNAVTQLAWIAKNKKTLLLQKGFDIGAGKGNSGGGKGSTKLSPEQQSVARRFGMTDEEYAKYAEESAPVEKEK